MSIQRTERRKQLSRWGCIDVKKVDYQKLKRSIEKEIDREKPNGFWGWMKNFFVSTRAERKMKLFRKLYPFVK